ncbi:putative PurR-regulated permease PerM [Catenulispora sp. EB89]|uniref:AI-2E family transporter n=1 Tax=Catenulispora sp. EB89 TaxID=3156257 RepID=UPI00351765B5
MPTDGRRGGADGADGQNGQDQQGSHAPHDLRPDPNPLLPRWAIRATAWNLALIVAVVVAAGLVWVCVELRAAVVPLLLALLATSLLEPAGRRLTGRIRSRSLAAGVACALLVGVVGGTAWLVARAIADAAPGIGRALGRIGQRIGVGSGEELVQSAADGLRSMGSQAGSALVAGVVHGVSTAVQILAGSVLSVVLIYFLIRDGDRFPAFVARSLPRGTAPVAVRMARRAWEALSGFMRGTTFIALIDAGLILIGLLILRVPGAGGLAALVFVGAYIPFIGAFLSGTVAVLVALGDGGVGKALWVLGVVVAVQVIEGNLLQPMIQSRTVSLHPAVVMLAVTGGTAVAGILGALLAVPLTAAASGVVAEWRETAGQSGTSQDADVPGS